MKRIPYFLIFLLLTLESCVIFQATKVPSNNTKNTLAGDVSKSPKIVFLGDSITHGRVSYDYVESIRNHPKLQNALVVNEGINSRLTVQILEELDSVIQLKPDYVFLLIGTNDLKATLSQEEYDRYASLWKLKDPVTEDSFVRNLNLIIERIQKNTKAKIIVSSPPVLGEDPKSIPFLRSKRFAELTKDVCAKQKVSYIPLHETLTKELELLPNLPKKAYVQSTWSMYWTILKYYSTTSSWNDLGESNGYYFLTDAIHLNERGGKIFEQMILETLLSP
ncbi:SGNH/GDSL hydrolase family protein [Leptospira biflexa]|uniref:SGNH/GDSL hydrolase family protein n=1 Tax=Leptospira biflexa TaxID=172 RepID=UPI001090F31C|nr:SGNH/GDSL hydrolase family protein [Leptospira biflexa]TGM42522.1 SGNH/GDSL hydrolase family protein [Leptospira biflexa]TGM44408.1 SGNH/GDSL hydrolase family protein [Leptospira biflexa]